MTNYLSISNAYQHLELHHDKEGNCSCMKINFVQFLHNETAMCMGIDFMKNEKWNNSILQSWIISQFWYILRAYFAIIILLWLKTEDAHSPQKNIRAPVAAKSEIWLWVFQQWELDRTQQTIPPFVGLQKGRGKLRRSQGRRNQPTKSDYYYNTITLSPKL